MLLARCVTEPESEHRYLQVNTREGMLGDERGNNQALDSHRCGRPGAYGLRGDYRVHYTSRG